MLVLWLLALVPRLGADEGTAPPRFEFPPGAARTLVLGLDAQTPPAELARGDRAPDWDDPQTFERWRASLAKAGTRDPGLDTTVARARLTLLALRQERADDAWSHLEAAGGDPRLLAALLPRFLPGVGADDPVGLGGLAGPLPDGVVLAPATPPRTRPPQRGRVERRAMKVSGLRVGEAVLALRVAVEPEGVQIDITHLAGGPARVAVRLPVEPGFTLANEYVDWYQAPARGVAHVLEIRPGDEEHTLYGRFEPDPNAVVFALPPARPALLDTGGLAIRPATGERGRAQAEALARALAGKPLEIEARVVPPGTPAAPDGRAALEIDLTDPRLAAAKVRALCGAVERFVLR